MATIYIETSIIGYLTARSANDVIFQARQKLTQDWWNEQRDSYELFTSPLVFDEAGAGDPEAASERLAKLKEIPLLDLNEPVVSDLADLLLREHLLPEKARADAKHISIATVYGMDYLLTWNCKHIANATVLPHTYDILRDEGYQPPLIVTPQEFSSDV